MAKLSFETRLAVFSKNHSVEFLSKISKGFSSEIHLAKGRDGSFFAVKIERDKSPRKDMCLKEYFYLCKANSFGIGPQAMLLDEECRAIAMEFVNGETFNKWLLEGKPSKVDLEHFLDALFAQAKKLDEIGLSHGQLAGKGKNILVRKKGNFFEPVIIDFEKASFNRKCRNANQLEAFIHRNPGSVIVKTVERILGLKKDSDKKADKKAKS